MSLSARRINSDLVAIHRARDPHIMAQRKNDSVHEAEAIIIGPEETPYAHGFFHFDVKFPEDYPFNPPVMKFLTTDNGRVRFNPNLYADGKICVSFLGTWQGPGWVATMSLLSCLRSIQGLILTSNPIVNEPGWESTTDTHKIRSYNQMLAHETLRVAVIQMVENYRGPFLDRMKQYFLDHYDYYLATARSLRHLDGQSFNDPYRSSRRTFNFTDILSNLARVKSLFDSEL
ncbi:hypothetical protein P9112_012650 [Eukaryota sp. TZLM1-RC]